MCLCGDYCCSSCGPAQGNSRCPLCNEWISEGCIHIDEETGTLKTDFIKAAEEAIAAENAMWAKFAEEERIARVESKLDREDYYS